MKKIIFQPLAVIAVIALMIFLAAPANGQSKKKVVAALNQCNSAIKDLRAENKEMAQELAGLADFQKNKKAYEEAYKAKEADLEEAKATLVAKVDTLVGVREDLIKAKAEAEAVKKSGGKLVVTALPKGEIQINYVDSTATYRKSEEAEMKPRVPSGFKVIPKPR